MDDKQDKQSLVTHVGLKRHTFPEASKRHKIVKLDKLA